METCPLICHPDHPPTHVGGVSARIIGLGRHWLRLRWVIEGAGALVVPPFAGKGRADGLWQATCFELFVSHGQGGAYAEFNLSPSERWAAYDFTGYREGMANRPVPRDPVCTLRRGQARGGQGMAIFDADIPLAALPPLPWDAGLCAVIEEEGGVKSYWALRHPAGRADFHHPDCFALEVAPPSGA